MSISLVKWQYINCDKVRNLEGFFLTFPLFLKWSYLYITGMNLGLIQNKYWQKWITIYLFICTFLSDQWIVGFRSFMFDVKHIANLWSIFPADLEANRLQRKKTRRFWSKSSRQVWTNTFLRTIRSSLDKNVVIEGRLLYKNSGL